MCRQDRTGGDTNNDVVRPIIPLNLVIFIISSYLHSQRQNTAVKHRARGIQGK